MSATTASRATVVAWGAGIFVVGALITAILMPNTALAPSEGEPVIGH